MNRLRFVYTAYLCGTETGSFERETWSLTCREEHRPRAFVNTVLRTIFGPKRDEVTEGWRNLYGEELHNLYSSLSIIRMVNSRRMRWTGHVALMGREGMYLRY
jgi:hypothetical protein